MTNLYSSPIREKKVRNGVIAYQYPNGVINIDGEKYFYHSMSSAISHYRRNHKKVKK